MSYQNLPPSSFQNVIQAESAEATLEIPMYSDKDFKQIFKNVDPNIKDLSLFGKDCDERTFDKILCGAQETSVFSRAFFSRSNILEIQKLIRYQVYLNSKNKYIIGDQSETELIIIMKSIYLRYSKMPKDYSCYAKEISRLNEIIVSRVIPGIINNIEQYIGYIKDSSSAPELLERSKNDSSAGTKEPRSFSDILFGDSTFFG
jgi:hypothetical protein